MRQLLPRALGAALCAALGLLAWWLWVAPRPGVDPGTVTASEKKPRAPAILAPTAPALTPGEQARALDRLLAGEPFVLNENGQPRRFRLSLHELYLPAAAAGERLQAIDPQPHARALAATAKQAGAPSQTAGWVLYPLEAEKDDPALRRVLHTQLLLQVKDRSRARQSLAGHGLRFVDEPSYAPNHWIVEAPEGPAAALTALAQISADPAFASAAPLLLHAHSPKLVPDDALFSQQWHLQNTGQGGGKAGADINVTSAWDSIQGAGVRIGIIDSGFDMLHPDLVPNLDSANHYDWNDFPPDTNPAGSVANGDFHGTAVAGVAAARGGNAVGISGVAPLATLVGFRLIAEVTTDAQDGDAMSRGSDVIQIKNSSWGHADGYPWLLYTPGPLVTAARKSAATTGRGGLGTVFVWAAGNGRSWGDQGNKDSFANSMYAINVGAVDNRGVLTSYSETGAHLTVVAPSSGGTRKIVTSDFRGTAGYNTGSVTGNLADLSYTNGFGGTSAAAPVVSGVVALMLQANPNLSWRDVKEILLRSSAKVAPTDSGWTSRTGGLDPALAPIKHHHSYGGGMVNAQAAVTMSAAWSPLPEAVEVTRTQNWTAPSYGPIPDNNATGLTTVFDFSDAEPLRVENVTVTLNIQHPYRGDLQIALRSPAGVESLLATKESRDSGEHYYDFTFSSMRHWGEASKGQWQIIIKDLAPSDKGYITAAKVSLHGIPITPVEITGYSQEPQLLEEGTSLALTASASGFGHITHQWTRGSTVVGNGATYASDNIGTAGAGTYQFHATNLSGTVTTAPVSVGVVRRAVAPVTVKEGAAFSFKVTAAGPGLAFQWLKGGEALVDDGRITGAQTATLTVKNAGESDSAAYVCRVTMNGLELETLPAGANVLMKPVLSAPDMTSGLVSSFVSYEFLAAHGATRFTASGVPRGITFSTSTGALSGQPSAPGTFKLRITATNAAGASAPLTVTWTVNALPDGFRGTFSGLVDRHDDWNSGLGGSFRINVTATGAFTGTLLLGGRSHALTGRLEVNAAGTLASAQPKVQKIGTSNPPAVTFSIDSTGLLTGAVGDLNNSASLLARHSPWSRTTPAPALAGRFNAFLDPNPPPLADDVLPYGNGYAVGVITTSGSVTWAGKLADGSAITGGTTVGAGGEIPLYLNLYGATGSARGWTTITAASGHWDGALDWLKKEQPATSRTRQYKGGFPIHSLTLVGARYTAPSPGSPALDLPPVTGNAQIAFTDGGLADPLTQSFTVTSGNSVKMPSGGDNANLVRLSLNAATGLISGSFSLKDPDPTDTTPPIAIITRSASFAGVLVTRAGVNEGRGYFLLPVLPENGPPKTTAATSPILSGRLVVGPP